MNKTIVRRFIRESLEHSSQLKDNHQINEIAPAIIGGLALLYSLLPNVANAPDVCDTTYRFSSSQIAVGALLSCCLVWELGLAPAGSSVAIRFPRVAAAIKSQTFLSSIFSSGVIAYRCVRIVEIACSETADTNQLIAKEVSDLALELITIWTIHFASQYSGSIIAGKVTIPPGIKSASDIVSGLALALSSIPDPIKAMVPQLAAGLSIVALNSKKDVISQNVAESVSGYPISTYLEDLEEAESRSMMEKSIIDDINRLSDEKTIYGMIKASEKPENITIFGIDIINNWKSVYVCSSEAIKSHALKMQKSLD